MTALGGPSERARQVFCYSRKESRTTPWCCAPCIYFTLDVPYASRGSLACGNPIIIMVPRPTQGDRYQ